MRERQDLRFNQRVGVDFILKHPGAMLAKDMGLGKTATTLTAIRDLLDSFLVERVLIIAPLLVAEETWPTEIDEWRHTAVLDYEVLTGDEERRSARALKPAEIHIVNRENIVWLIDFWGDEWPYDMIVVDEMSSFKNPSMRNKPTKAAIGKVTKEALAALPKEQHTDEAAVKQAVDKAVKKLKSSPTRFAALRKVRKRVSRLIGLTGTPAPNGLGDLWAQYFLIDQGYRLGITHKAFLSRWFESDYMGHKYTPRPGAFEEIVGLISDITLSMKTEDYVDMPAVIHNTVSVTLPDKVLKRYKEFERTMLLEEHDIEAVNQGVLTGKLLQLANGSVYNDEGEAIEIHSLKLDALDRIIEEAAGAPVLVAYSYQFDLAKLKKRYPYAEVVGEGKDIVKRWNARKIRLLLAHPQSAGHGLNLQYGGNITVWYGLCWSLEFYQQLNKRLHRPGQKETVIIHHIVSRGTIDERVMRVLPEKDALQSSLIEATKYVHS